MTDSQKDIDKVLKETGVKLDDALAYADKYIQTNPKIKDNKLLCLRLYLNTKGISVDDILSANYARTSQMKDGENYKANLIIAEEMEPIEYNGCPETGKSLKKTQVGDEVVCECKKCKGATVRVSRITMRRFWAGDEDGNVVLTFPMRVEVPQDIIGRVVTVEGTYSVQQNVPSFMANRVRVKGDISSSVAKSQTLTQQPVAVEPVKVEPSQPDPAKQEEMDKKVTKFLKLYGWSIDKKMFDRWFNNQFPSVDSTEVLARLHITTKKEGEKDILSMNPV